MDCAASLAKCTPLYINLRLRQAGLEEYQLETGYVNYATGNQKQIFTSYVIALYTMRYEAGITVYLGTDLGHYPKS